MSENTNGFDEQKSEAFADSMVESLNQASMVLMTSIGHRAGLFDTMAEMEPSTTHQIAETSGLNERYIREWLGAMVTSKIVTYDQNTREYQLPVEHAVFLTRKASPNNIAAFTQWIPVLASVEDHVTEAFSHGKGVPYSAYDRFTDVMEEDSGQTVVAALEEYILPLVPGLMDRLHAGINVMDIACGSGKAVNKMASLFPNSTFTGYDFLEEGILRGRAESNSLGLINTRFDVLDAAELSENEEYDLITAFDAIHDQPKPDTVLRNLHNALRPGGIFLMQDIKASSHLQNNLDHPVGPFLYTISTMHCMSVSLAHGGPGLGACWGKEKALEMLDEAGFTGTDVKELSHDFQNYFYISGRNGKVS
jgi:2-polyprenyl-3-methyl-5-hydroxy-6-metoxy-1,4-benzoquinol methylase